MARVIDEKVDMTVVEESKLNMDDLLEVFASLDRKIQQECKSHTCTPCVKAEGVFSDILNTLGLKEYYPSKISQLDAMVIERVTEDSNLGFLPWKIIQRLLIIDHHARDQLLPVVKGFKAEDSFGVDDFLGNQVTTTGETDATYLNPLDVMVAIFTCCDNFLKQTIAQKMFICKLAIPFLYPLGSKDIVLMSLWSLRTITVQSHTGSPVTETPVTDKPLPLVTFVRLGRPPFSKSKLINDILRDDSHNTFFNHDCNNGTVARRFTDGLVECSWFISTGKEKEHLPRTTMFLNLRGDASAMERQMQVLKDISSVMFVITTAKDLARTSNTNTCQQILQTNAKVILFLICGNSREEKQACIEAVGIDLLKEKRARILPSTDSQGIELNASELKSSARRLLFEAIADGCTCKDMEECAKLANKYGIVTDEHDDEFCVEGKSLAENVLRHIEDQNIVECKDTVLPLQGSEWSKYCKLLKKQHRVSGKDSKTSSADQADKIQQEMDHLREEQVNKCQELNPFIKDFILNLQKKSAVILYFLKWMTTFLDEISRKNLPHLRREYYARWTEFQEAKGTKDKEKMEQLKTDVDVAENQLASASFGLEHLFRELGQIYEAVKGSNITRKDIKTAVEYLPEIAAKLLIKGISLELVDGDTSSVPIAWIRAVLENLGNIIGEKRLFVLSVLGIQSSGKSTLLNTMFGLQFSVSAGRCTRGAYMQLVPVDDHAELPFDYVVVLDTEGLRAPELAQLKYDHDNELATLVIGLGDVTLVNIKGENTFEMKDILQIAVHAFLRMKSVTRHIKDHKTCIFVHQNVPAANADELMMHGSQKLLESLDDMTKEAAHSEKIADIHSFSQIINFDVKKHVWYFSDLWHGNPPMAPANPGYSEKVSTVRANILGEIASKQTTFLTTSDLSIRLDDLWNGVLADDFVFSFRNSLEVKAFNELQSLYYTLEWRLQSDLKSWVYKKERELKMLTSIIKLDESFLSLEVELSKLLQEKADEVKTQLKDYFSRSNLQEIIIQWQQSMLSQLEIKVMHQRTESKADLFSIKEARRVEILQSEKWSHTEERIMNKATNLAEKMKGKETSDAELEVEFNTMWVDIENMLSTNSDEKNLEMDVLMEGALYAGFKSHAQGLKLELKRKSLKKPLINKSLEGSISEIGVGNEDISLKTSIKKKFIAMFTGDKPELQAKRKTVVMTRNILQEVSTYLRNLQSIRDIKFQTACATDVIHIIKDAIDKYNDNDDHSFTILPAYGIKLAVHVSRYCVEVFSRMQSEYNEEHGVRAKLNKYKEIAWSMFKNMVKQSTEQVIAADTLCTQLKGVIEETVRKEIPRKIVEEILTDFQMTKYTLILQIMDDLARKDDFMNYMFYIHNAKMFAMRWLTEYTNKKMFDREKRNNMSRYAEIAKLHINKIITCVTAAIEYATEQVKEATETSKKNCTTDKEKLMEQWVETFSQKVSEEIAIPVSELKQVRKRKVVDFNHLKFIILSQMDKVQADVMRVFADTFGDTVTWHGVSPPKIAMERIWGCEEQCPFCEEPCTITTQNHYDGQKQNHACLQHRPEGIGGAIYDSDTIIDGVDASHQLMVDTCNYNVQRKDVMFHCSACNFQCRKYSKCTTTGKDTVPHKCTDYHTYLQEWNISPDSTNSVSKYWMWFMKKYQNELKDVYNARSLRIPESWKQINLEDALADLRKIH